MLSIRVPKASKDIDLDKALNRIIKEKCPYIGAFFVVYKSSYFNFHRLHFLMRSLRAVRGGDIHLSV